MVCSRGIPLPVTAASSFLLLNIMEDLSETVPHGTCVFDVHSACECELCGPKRRAVFEFAGQFSVVPTRWILGLSEVWDEPVSLPL